MTKNKTPNLRMRFLFAALLFRTPYWTHTHTHTRRHTARQRQRDHHSRNDTAGAQVACTSWCWFPWLICDMVYTIRVPDGNLALVTENAPSPEQLQQQQHQQRSSHTGSASSLPLHVKRAHCCIWTVRFSQLWLTKSTTSASDPTPRGPRYLYTGAPNPA